MGKRRTLAGHARFEGGQAPRRAWRRTRVGEHNRKRWTGARDPTRGWNCTAMRRLPAGSGWAVESGVSAASPAVVRPSIADAVARGGVERNEGRGVGTAVARITTINAEPAESAERGFLRFPRVLRCTSLVSAFRYRYFGGPNTGGACGMAAPSCLGSEAPKCTPPWPIMTAWP
jgi:hypothetical protein